jgi:hypothetical protein
MLGTQLWLVVVVVDTGGVGGKQEQALQRWW